MPLVWEPEIKPKLQWEKPKKPRLRWEKPTRGGLDWSGTEGNVFARMSKFQKVLDILGRPGYATKAMMRQSQIEAEEAIKDIPMGDTSELRWARTVAIMKKKPQIKRRMQAAWRGLTGKERHAANELWKNVGIEGVPLLGFATELISDPMMYGGYQAITKTAGKVIGGTGKALQKLPPIAKAKAALKVRVEPVTSALREMFVTKTGLGKLNDLIELYLSKREFWKIKEMRYGIKIRNAIQKIARKTKRPVGDVERQVVNLIEQPQIVPRGVPVESKVLANTIRMHLSNILTSEMKAGVPITSLAGGARNIHYFPRITTREATQYLKQARIGNARVWNTKLANALGRKTRDFTLQEFNDFVATHGLKSLGGRAVEEFFMQHPAYAVATRGIRSAKAISSAQFLKDTGKIYGMRKQPLGWIELPETITRLNPSLKRLYFDPEVAAEITRVSKAYFNPNEAKIFLRTFDWLQTGWKRWVLAPFPKYHLRNMVGNTWNIYLEGSTKPTHFAKMQALQTYRKYKGTSRMGRFALMELRKLGITPQQADDLILRMEKTGVLGRGWYAADIETTMKQALGRKGVIERGMAFGTTIENNARGALFLSRLDQGDDTLRAAQTVKKYLFDYGNLTDFERKVMKRLFPFYTWTRKNVPLQLEHLWKQPQRFAPLAIPLRARDEEDLLKLKYARPDLYERLPVELRRNVDTVTYVPLEGLIPAGDLAKMVRPQEILTELLSPYLRTPIELMMNKSFYFESEIQRYPQETQEFLRMDIPIKLKYALTTLPAQARLLSTINQLFRKKVRKEEFTPAETIFHHTLSSIWKISLKDLRIRALKRVEKKMEDLSRGLFWAKRYGRVQEYERIKRTYDQLKEEIKKIKSY